MNIKGRIRNRGNISVSEIKQAYIRVFNIGLCQRKRVCFHLADETYDEADIDLIKQVITENQANKALYITEKKDCDNFAFALMGALRGVDDRTCAMPIFITWVLTPENGHAVLSFYYKGTVKIIEPQLDSVFEVPKEWRLLLLCG